MYVRSDQGRKTQIPGWELDYFTTKEWLDVQDKLDELEQRKILVCPDRNLLFKCLGLCSLSACVCAIVGQDPYPEPQYATGVAFSIPETTRMGSIETKDGRRFSPCPASLRTIYQELVNDLKVPYPPHGNLESWCKQGVLLWNAIPVYSPMEGVSGVVNLFANNHFFDPLTQEIIERLSAKGNMVFVFVGHKARKYAEFVDASFNDVIYVSHPSPRGQLRAHSKFLGSRLFSTINAYLINRMKEPIDWTIE